MFIGMKWVPVLLAFALAGCARAKNTFEVEDPQGLVRSATLRLCGSETPLLRAGNKLILSHPITCEGDGEIQLFYKEGGPERCLVGYVTPGAKQDFHFRADHSSCQPLT
jgi:hypothetical protein